MSHASFPPAAVRPSRLLMTTDAVTGRWHYATGIARALKPHGIELHMAVPGPGPTSAQRSEVALIGNVTLHDHPYALEWMPNPWDDIARAGEWLLSLEERVEPDLIHLNHYCYAALPWNAPVLLAAHGDRLSWARAAGEALPPMDEERYLSELLAGLRSADLVIAPTHATLNDLRHHYQPNRQSSDCEPFRCAPRVIPHARCRRHFLSRPKREFILAAGCVRDAGKNLAALDDAARDLPWPLFLAGSTDDSRAGGTEFFSVDCLGPLSPNDLANWMGLASIFVLPSRYESTGLTAMEAALCGCALVLSDLPCLREVWEDAALFVDPTRPLEIANALQKLIRTPELRTRLSHLARKRALQHTPEQQAESLLECYRDLLVRQSSLGESLNPSEAIGL